jgi:AraC family transcriptional regulator, regulatory protein of adaptative response / DNA-3-methyladenine glycosylase II
MNLDLDICYDAIVNRDATFDGKIFVTVKTTQIYCRPVCPAPKPKKENCQFVASATLAEMLGYRPCKRCRPESLPGSPAWSGTLASVSRALKLIEDGALDKGSVGDMANKLGIGERHLRRLFKKHLGTSPTRAAGQNRLYLVKSLLSDQRLSIQDAALGAGFKSVRRFNTAFRQAFGITPGQYRTKEQQK